MQLIQNSTTFEERREEGETLHRSRDRQSSSHTGYAFLHALLSGVSTSLHLKRAGGTYLDHERPAYGTVPCGYPA